MKDRTWITVSSIVIVAFWTGIVCQAREYALWKSGFRDYFFFDDGTIDRDIALLRDHCLRSVFALYSVTLLGLIPVALQKLFQKISIALPLIALLFAPVVWYGLRIIHVSGKMVDWAAVFDGH